MTDDDLDAVDDAYDPTDAAMWAELLGPDGSVLVQDRGVAHAIATGSPKAIHAALLKKRKGTTPAESRRIDEALDERRLFAEATKPPGLSTLNGVGTRLYGKADRGDDGTYIATRYLTAVFVPVVPLGSYLVSDGGSGGWTFHAKVPLSGVHRIWRAAVGVLCAVLALLIVGALWWSQGHADVQLVNGLDVPVHIAIGEHEQTIRPGERIAVEVAEGTYALGVTTMNGTVLDERTVEVDGGADLIVCNVLGAAPIVLEGVPYTASGVPERVAEENGWIRTKAGVPWIVVDDVDLVFEASPDQIDMPRGKDVVVRSVARLDSGGWRVAVQALYGTGELQRAAELACRAALTTPDDIEPFFLAWRYTQAAGDSELSLRLADDLVRVAPDVIDAHRIRQEILLGEGAEDALLSEYRTRFEANADSPFHGYLYARILPHDEGLAIYERLIATHPDDPWLRRGAGWITYQRGEWSAAIEHLSREVQTAPERIVELGGMLARAQLATGDGMAALDSLLAAIEGSGDAMATWDLTLTYGRVYTVAGQPTAARASLDILAPLIGENPDPDMLAEIQAILGADEDAEPASSAGSRRFVELTRLARSDVGAAADLALTTDADVLVRLRDATQVALAAELARRGESEPAARLLDGLTVEAARHVTAEVLAALPSVADVSEDLGIELRSALLVSAARRVDDPAERERLMTEARRLDPLQWIAPR